MLKKLNEKNLSELQEWLKQFKFLKTSSFYSNKFHRDFSDGTILSQILFQLYPKLVNLNNYPPRNSVVLKLNSLTALNYKVLRKLEMFQSYDSLEKIAKCEPGAVENFLYDLYIKQKKDQEKSREPGDNDCYENAEVLVINVNQKVGDGLIQIPQKMIVYSSYEKLLDELTIKENKIATMEQKIIHLENVLKLKSERIEDLSSKICKLQNIALYKCSNNGIL